MPSDDRRMPDCVLNLLLAAAPLIKTVRDERREHLRRAFLACALKYGTEAMNTDEGRLPTNPHEAAQALHVATLDLCQRAGISRVDLSDAYNAHGEAGTFADGGVDEAARRAAALLSIFYARALTDIEVIA